MNPVSHFAVMFYALQHLADDAKQYDVVDALKTARGEIERPRFSPRTAEVIQAKPYLSVLGCLARLLEKRAAEVIADTPTEKRLTHLAACLDRLANEKSPLDAVYVAVREPSHHYRKEIAWFSTKDAADSYLEKVARAQPDHDYRVEKKLLDTQVTVTQKTYVAEVNLLTGSITSLSWGDEEWEVAPDADKFKVSDAPGKLLVRTPIGHAVAAEKARSLYKSWLEEKLAALQG